MELNSRLKAKTPIWFKRIIRLALTMSASGTALLTAGSAIPKFHLSSWVEQAAQMMVVAGLVAAAISKTAKEDNDA